MLRLGPPQYAWPVIGYVFEQSSLPAVASPGEAILEVEAGGAIFLHFAGGRPAGEYYI